VKLRTSCQLLLIVLFTLPVFSQRQGQQYVPPPSRLGNKYTLGAASFRYPSNWQVINSREEDVLIGPPEAIYVWDSGPGRKHVWNAVQSHGIIFGYYQANLATLDGAADELLGRFKQRYRRVVYYPNFDVRGLCGGRPCLRRDVQVDEAAWVLDSYLMNAYGTLFLLQDGTGFYYWLVFASYSTSTEFNPTLTAILDSITLDGIRLQFIPIVPTISAPSDGVMTNPPDSERGIREEPVHSFGTGFFVSKEGHILTNNHVVKGCRRITSQNGELLQLVARDTGLDLALLKAHGGPPQIAVFRTGAPLRLGDSVIVFGFPLPGVLSAQGNLTTGVLSATAGLQDDIRHIQITAPVQPGNSGGPLLDSSGHVVGVVVSKLDVLKIADVTGDLPQNVNFAINWAEVRTFLDEQAVPFSRDLSLKTIPTSDIAARAAQYSVAIECTQ